ncbi:MAG: 30S ribosomal protein S9 [Candidatus Parcubacteria bacterium]|nr:30S ribosomal protein S9 [Candidatus Parcubacteria bacterium]
MAEKIIPKIKEQTRYFPAVGRRKTAIATVRLYPKGSGQITINDKKLTEYFPTILNQDIVNAPLKITSLLGKFDITIIVRGGGKTGQAEAIRLGIARALQDQDKELRKTLKVAGFLKRDARIKERKKPGLKRARKAPQWAKR